MKKILMITVALVLCLCAGAMAGEKKSGKKQARMEFAKTTHDFGMIPEKGGKVSHTFEFTNTGDANLVIVDARADCGCTVPEYPATPVAPGKTGRIKVTYDPLYRPGGFTKVVTVRTNAKNKKTRLVIQGTVNPNK